jgi:uncharacterized protein (DUF305 family)
MNRKFVIAGLVTASVLAVSVALANMQDSSQGHGMMHGPMMMQGMQGGGMHGSDMHGSGSHAVTMPKGDQSPSSLAFAGVNAKMHQGMDVTFSGNADRDFVQGMIPHHQGAVDMAKVVLAFGKDPEVRKLAETIIKSQEEEIAWMNSWLKKTAAQ